MTKTLKSVAFVFVALALAGAQQITRTGLAQSAVVARVNGSPLYERDLAAQMRTLFPFYSVHGGKIPPNAQAEIRQKAMDRLVFEELAYAEAKRRGLTITKAELDARIAKARKSSPSDEDFDEAIRETYGSTKEFRRRAERAALVEKLWTIEVTNKSRVTDVDIAKFYRANKSRFQRPQSVRLQTISFNFPENVTPEQREQVRKSAEAVLPKAKDAKTAQKFGELAEKHSQDDWRVMSGDHGWVHRGTLEAALDSAFTMKAGQVSGLIESSKGLHILRVNEVRPARQMTLAEVRKDIRASLQKEREQQNRQRFESELRSQAKVEYQ